METILDAVTKRQFIEKFSYVANITERSDFEEESIEGNLFNLNIPRYVDTYEEEELIDLNAVNSDLMKLDDAIRDVDQVILKFCQELNITYGEMK